MRVDEQQRPDNLICRSRSPESFAECCIVTHQCMGACAMSFRALNHSSRTLHYFLIRSGPFFLHSAPSWKESKNLRFISSLARRSWKALSTWDMPTGFSCCRSTLVTGHLKTPPACLPFGRRDYQVSHVSSSTYHSVITSSSATEAHILQSCDPRSSLFFPAPFCTYGHGCCSGLPLCSSHRMRETRARRGCRT